MKLGKHIVSNLLYDKKLADEVATRTFPDRQADRLRELYELMDHVGNKNYFVTNTIIEKLPFLNVKKKEAAGEKVYDWTVFDQVKNCKKTFIYPTNNVLRIHVTNTHLQFIIFNKKNIEEGKYEHITWTKFWVERHTGRLSHNFNSEVPDETQLNIYRLLCFVFLSETEEVIVQPNGKFGTRKSGKVINELKDTVTVINSLWNITLISNETTLAQGYFAIRWTGPGRTVARVVIVDPYERHGYRRTAKKELENG